MPLNKLDERLESGAAARVDWAYVARDPWFSMIEKFEIINSSIRAEPLWECRLTPRVPYEINSFQRYEFDIFVNLMESVVGSYRLLANYAMMVSRRDIAVVNSHLHRFTLTRAVKHCDYRRLPFDDKPYNFELVLKQLPRKPSLPGVPPF